MPLERASISTSSLQVDWCRTEPGCEILLPRVAQQLPSTSSSTVGTTYISDQPTVSPALRRTRHGSVNHILQPPSSGADKPPLCMGRLLGGLDICCKHMHKSFDDDQPPLSMQPLYSLFTSIQHESSIYSCGPILVGAPAARTRRLALWACADLESSFQIMHLFPLTPC